MGKTILLILILIFQLVYCQTESLIVKKHFENITKTENFRNYKNIEQLNKIAEYIYDEFTKTADSVYYQKYLVGRIEYKNIVAIYGKSKPKTIVIGAHYDVCGDQEGADDNASGVIGLLEISRQLKDANLYHKIELVAYTLEEPPYFSTENMGSFIHAKSLKEKNEDVLGMISLEMIGYYKDEKKSQNFPWPIMSLFYGNKANFISIINKMNNGKFSKNFRKKFKLNSQIKMRRMEAPKNVTGIDFSDHLNYWKFNFDAFMITDTSFYRNKNYHEKTDEYETLDITKMCKVLDAVYTTVLAVK